MNLFESMLKENRKLSKEENKKRKIKESSFISDEELSTYYHKDSPDYEENELYELDPVDSDFEKLNDTPIEIEYVEDEHDPERDFQASFWWDGQRQYLDDIVRVHNNPWFNHYDNYPAYIHGISDDYMHPFFVEIVDGGDAVNIYREKYRRTESKKRKVKEGIDHRQRIAQKLIDRLSNKYELIKSDDKHLLFKCPENATHNDAIEFTDKVKDIIGGEYHGTCRGGSWTKWNLWAPDLGISGVEFQAGWSDSGEEFEVVLPKAQYFEAFKKKEIEESRERFTRPDSRMNVSQSSPIYDYIAPLLDKALDSMEVNPEYARNFSEYQDLLDAAYELILRYDKYMADIDM